jgi:hypothetical protein
MRLFPLLFGESFRQGLYKRGYLELLSSAEVARVLNAGYMTFGKFE